jgi:hypothetical protein
VNTYGCAVQQHILNWMIEKLQIFGAVFSAVIVMVDVFVGEGYFILSQLTGPIDTGEKKVTSFKPLL